MNIHPRTGLYTKHTKGNWETLKGVVSMATMKRTTISFPDELTDRIFALRKDERFIRCSYSEIIRQLAEMGLAILDEEQTARNSAQKRR